MTDALQSPFVLQISMFALLGMVGIYAIGLRIYWLFDKKAKLKDLATLRTRLEQLQPTDPEYNQVIAMYMAMVADAQHFDALHSYGHESGAPVYSDSGSDNGSDSGGHH